MKSPEDDTISSINRFLYAVGIEHGFKREIKSRLGEIARKEATADVLAELFKTVSSASFYEAERLLDHAEAQSISLLCILNPAYPSRLRAITDPPLMLFIDGTLPREAGEPGQPFHVGMVGTRHPTSYGRSFAYDFSKQAAGAGGVVVSGLAAGIDTASHSGALAAKELSGKAYPGIAVLGSGVRNIYPSENVRLAKELVEQGGAVISEYGLTKMPQQHFFPERNRIISGLSDAVVVVEAGEKSGALITARLAAEQGRDVGAVPGSTGSRMSDGPNLLLKSGAAMIRNLEDLMQMLPSWTKAKKVQPQRKPRVKKTDEVGVADSQLELGLDFGVDQKQQEALKGLLQGMASKRLWHFDELVETSGRDPAEVTSLLSLLELSGRIESHPGHHYSAISAP